MDQKQINRRRSKVRVRLFALSSFNSLATFKTMIAEAEQRIAAESLYQPMLDFEIEKDYYGHYESTTLVCDAYREETDEEVILRLQSEQTAEQREIERLTRQLEHLQRKQK